jgi:hypothetical protein
MLMRFRNNDINTLQESFNIKIQCATKVGGCEWVCETMRLCNAMYLSTSKIMLDLRL